MHSRYLAVAVLAMSAALVTPSLASAQDPLDPTQELQLQAGPFDRDLRVQGPDGFAPYLVVAGVQRNVEPGPFGLEVVPLAIVASGTLDVRGNALIPLDMMDAAHAGLVVHFQAIAAPVYTQLTDNLLISDALSLTAKAPETRIPSRRPADRVFVTASLDQERAHAALSVADGDFPELAAEIEIEVPTGGYSVAEPVVRWNEDFARIQVMLVAPGAGDLVSKGFVTHRLRVVLGSHVDQAEVAITVARPIGCPNHD